MASRPSVRFETAPGRVGAAAAAFRPASALDAAAGEAAPGLQSQRSDSATSGSSESSSDGSGEDTSSEASEKWVVVRRGGDQSRRRTWLSTWRSTALTNASWATKLGSRTRRKCPLLVPLLFLPWQIGLVIWIWWLLCVRHESSEEPIFGFEIPPKVAGGIYTFSSSLTFFCWACFEYLRVESTRGMGSAALMFFTGWMLMAVEALFAYLDRPDGWCVGYLACVEVFVQFFLIIVLDISERRAIQSRVEVVEAAFEEDLGSWRIGWLNFLSNLPFVGAAFGCMAGFVIMAFSPYCAPWLAHFDFREQADVHNYFQCILVFPLVAWISTAVLVSKAYNKVLWVARAPHCTGSAYVQAEADWARKVVFRARLASVLLPCLSCFACIVRVANTVVQLEVLFTMECGVIMTSVSLFLELLVMLWLMGLFQPMRPQVHVAGNRTPSLTSMSRQCSGSAWEGKVQELAHRSLTVGEILDFYALLGTEVAMPHYDPWRHTTNDVVRCAIIPLTQISGGGGRAYATSVGSHHPALPDRLVTHDWRNLFLHLLAAVIADALRQEEYKDIARMLAAGHADKLREMLVRSDTLDCRYWICALCVNQHTTICGDFGHPPRRRTPEYKRWEENRRDTVSGELLPTCSCGERRLLNDDDLCEVNKFDDMMSLIADRTPQFAQVVAVDRHFGILTRLWCIAEMVQAHVSGIPQNVKLLSSKVLHIDSPDLDVYARLANLRVDQCNATRQEDKEWILGKIPDLQEFDARLHLMIFGDHGLLQGKLVGLDILHAAVRTVLRVQAAARASDDRAGQAKT